MSEELPRDIEITFNDLIVTFDSFGEDEINNIPFEGSWTAGQLVRHVVKSGNGFVWLINGPAKETERSPDKHVENIKEGFMNFTIKSKSAEIIAPENWHYSKNLLIKNLTDIRDQLKAAAEKSDLFKTCTGFEIPMLGFLTRLESLYFVIFHTKRHTHQLKNIYKALIPD